MIIRIFHSTLNISGARGLKFSWLTMKKPISTRASVRLRICNNMLYFESPRAIREPMAKGIERPTINKKAGKMVSENPIPSSFAVACSSHCGTPCKVHRSFTKIINSMVTARKMSTDKILFVMEQAEGFLSF